MNSLTHVRKTTILRFVLAEFVLLFSVPPLFADGIASRYPNDVGIENDPDVILFDGFEFYTSPSQLRPKWNQAGPQANLRIATEPGNYVGGHKSLEMTLPIRQTETIDSVLKSLNPEETVLYIRAYEKFDPGFSVTTSGHNGLRIGGHYPGPGVPPPPDGTGFFVFTLQNHKGPTGRDGEVQPGFAQVYSYWPFQRSNFGDHWYSDGWVSPGGWGLWVLYPNQYPEFHPIPNWQPVRGLWYCYEFMVKTNTVGRNDGVVAYWIDGNLAGYFPDLFMRSINSLKINDTGLRLHALSSSRVNKKWYDNVVIARSYIGPISTPTPAVTSYLSNISTRGFVQTADNVMIGGFIVQGTQPKTVIVRAIGPELTPFGVPDVLADPTLELHNGAGALIASNNNWQTTIIGGIITADQVSAIQNSGHAPTQQSESAIIATLPPGNYTAIVRGVNDSTGVALAEVYDVSGTTGSFLGNISTREFVQTGDNVMIGGFIVQGTEPKSVILRAIGPELTQHGVPDALANPTLELHDETGALIASNDNWVQTIIGGIITTSQVLDIRNSGHAPSDSRESAIIADLPPGNYTAIVRGVNNTIGVGLVEVYDLD